MDKSAVRAIMARPIPASWKKLDSGLRETRPPSRDSMRRGQYCHKSTSSVTSRCESSHARAIRHAKSGSLCASLAPEEGQQVGVDLVLKRCRKAVRRARIVDFLRALDQPGRFPRRVLDWHDLVVLTVHDQGRNIELLEVLGEIGFGESLDAFVGVLQPGLHAPEPKLIQNTLGNLSPRPVGAVELNRQVLVELRAVLRDGTAQFVEHLDRQA